jgi:hypothetical protein
MKPFLIEIVSCAKDRPKQVAPRETWVKEWGHLVDYKFLLGKGNENAESDEWIFDVPDDWNGVLCKDLASHRRALELGYDYVFHISLDCYPIIPRLLSAFHELQGRDYVGGSSDTPYYLGGAGYWLSRRALEVTSNAVAMPVAYDDMRIGEVLYKARIYAQADARYNTCDQNTGHFGYEDPTIWQKEDKVSVHLGRGSGSFQPQWMYDCHRSYMEGGDHVYERLGL